VRKRERPTLSTKPLLMSFDDGGLIPITPERLEKSDRKSGKIVQRKSCSSFSGRQHVLNLGQTLRYRSLFVAGLRLDPGDGILPCTTVTELVDCVQSLCLLFVREWSRPGQGFLTETSQSCRGVRIRLDFCRKGRIAMCAGRWIPAR
jgi:hypothetical protein